jgi:hypothetical protein
VSHQREEVVFGSIRLFSHRAGPLFTHEARGKLPRERLSNVLEPVITTATRSSPFFIGRRLKPGCAARPVFLS